MPHQKALAKGLFSFIDFVVLCDCRKEVKAKFILQLIPNYFQLLKFVMSLKLCWFANK
jgi:hypothetical protein